MHFDAMSGIPHIGEDGRMVSEINFMQLWDDKVAIHLAAESVKLEGADAVELELFTEVAGQKLSKTIYAPPFEDLMVMLFHLYKDPSDYFVLQVMQPFVQQVCDVMGKPMIRVIKPEPQNLPITGA